MRKCNYGKKFTGAMHFYTIKNVSRETLKIPEGFHMKHFKGRFLAKIGQRIHIFCEKLW